MFYLLTRDAYVYVNIVANVLLYYSSLTLIYQYNISITLIYQCTINSIPGNISTSRSCTSTSHDTNNRSSRRLALECSDSQREILRER